MVKKMLCLVCMVALLTGTAYGAIGDVWDLGDSYSEADNPNGAWSYRNSSNSSLLLTTAQVWGAGPLAWSTNGAMGGAWYFRPDLGQFTAQPIDDFVTAGGLQIRWVSPVTGTIDITGSLWGIWGGASYEVFVSPVAVAGLTISKGSGAAPGGGATAAADNRTPFGLQMSVMAGDVVDFHVGGGSGGEYRIEQIPEPMTMSLLGLGALGLLRRRRSA